MTAAAASFRRHAARVATARDLAVAAGLIGATFLVVAIRAAGVRAGLDPLALGLAFGAALAGVAAASAAGGWRRRGQGGRAVLLAALIGIGAGLALVAITSLAPVLAGEPSVPGLGRPAAPFLPWVAVTIVVATAQEALLRGALFDRFERLGGPALAIAGGAVVFALMHVPLYGWHVVPLDLAVGIALGGLRLVTGRVAAPATAHATADLATWWL
jgi:membrane protease YdiL (CAAX protease family)